MTAPLGAEARLEIPAEVREAWERRYYELVGSAGDDADELRRIDELLARVDAGLSWTETGEELFIGSTSEWSESAVRTAAGEGTDSDANRRRLVLFIGGALAVMLVLIALVLVPVFARGSRRASAGPAAATPPTAEVADAAIVPVAVASGNTRLPLDSPRSLELRGQAYPIVTGKLDKAGAVVVPNLDDPERVAVWFASPVNWLIGMDEVAVRSLLPGERLTARTGTGRVLTFVVDEVADVPPQAIDQLAQTRPGLTLFPLPASGPDIHLVSARYEFEGEAPGVAAGAATQFGAGVRLAGGQAALSGLFVEAQPDGLFAVTVLGQAALDAGQMAVPVQAALDIAGQVYAPVAPVAPLGAGPFKLAFRVPAVGAADLVLNGERLSLGTLTAPALSAQIVGVALDDRAVTLTLAVTAAGGAASPRPGDLAISLSAGRDRAALAPVSVSPDAPIVAGQPASLTVVFQLPEPPERPAVFQATLFGQLWEIEVP